MLTIAYIHRQIVLKNTIKICKGSLYFSVNIINSILKEIHLLQHFFIKFVGIFPFFFLKKVFVIV